MMTKSILVNTPHGILLLSPEVARLLGVKHGDYLDHIKSREALIANLEYGIAACQAELGKAVIN